MQSTPDCLKQLNKLKSALKNAEAVLIGAGAGLSTSAGLTYSGERFFKYFADFHAKYGITDIYSGGFYPYQTLEEYWAWWSRHIYYNRYVEPTKPVYDELYELVKDKDYFVLTTNVDHCFQKAGFDKKRLFYTQGDYGLFQCSVPCHNKSIRLSLWVCTNCSYRLQAALHPSSCTKVLSERRFTVIGLLYLCLHKLRRGILSATD